MKEVWKDIPGYEGFYQASDMGRVRSLDRVSFCHKGNGHDMKFKGRILSPCPDKDGYERVILAKRGKNKYTNVHRLVAAAFLENKHNYPVVNHLNEIKNDNRASNLEWCSIGYNNVYNDRAKKANVKNYKPVRATNVKTGEKMDFESISKAGTFGFRLTNIIQCCKGDKKTHCGYTWEYINKERSTC